MKETIRRTCISLTNIGLHMKRRSPKPGMRRMRQDEKGIKDELLREVCSYSYPLSQQKYNISDDTAKTEVVSPNEVKSSWGGMSHTTKQFGQCAIICTIRHAGTVECGFRFSFSNCQECRLPLHASQLKNGKRSRTVLVRLSINSQSLVQSPNTSKISCKIYTHATHNNYTKQRLYLVFLWNVCCFRVSPLCHEESTKLKSRSCARWNCAVSVRTTHPLK